MAKSTKPRSADFNYRRLRSNLARHAGAMSRLAAMGVGLDLADALGLGIKEPYVRADGTAVEGVLAYPLDAGGGRRRYGYVNLEGVTRGAEHAVAWGPGAPATVRSGGGGTVIVVGSPVHAWQLGAAAARLERGVVAVSSSQPDALPDEWTEASFWAPWDRVVLADGVPDAVAARVLAAARRPVETARGIECAPEVSKVAIDRRHEDWLEEILGCAKVAGARVVALAEGTAGSPGDFAAAPIPVHGGFARGYLFYPFMVERRRPGGAGGQAGLLHSYETLVLRSDGAVLEPEVLRAPAGTPAGRRVHALSDGTRIEATPQPSRQATWSLEAIQRYASDCASGVAPCRRPSEAIMDDVHAYLASRVHLPDRDDLAVVSAFVVMTHMFRVFNALPLLLVVGERGSGKSELASAVVALGFNAVMMGQGSAAALVRLTRECGGLVALDDAEGLSTPASGFGELGQCLKLGYKSATAKRAVTLASGRVDTFDFYGPRLVTSTRGVDPVLRSRCVEIATAPAPAVRPVGAAPDPASLRDELHALAMSRAADVAEVYSTLGADAHDRHSEIWAPLTAIATVLGGHAFVASVARRRGQTAALPLTDAA